MLQPKLFKFGHFIRLYSHFKPAYFTKNHEWLSAGQEGAVSFIARVGITDYSQKALGDIVFVELPKVGSLYHKDDAIATVESAKGATDVYAPITGKVVQVNSAMTQKPSILNKSAEVDGWICELEAIRNFAKVLNKVCKPGLVQDPGKLLHMDELLKSAQAHAPIFQVNASDVSFLSSPDDFYQTILKRIETAEDKILISTLYIGTDELSVALVKKLEEKMQSSPNLSFQLIIDHSRGSREAFNSFSLIKPLLSLFGSDRVQVVAYKNPFSRRYSQILPAKVKEFIGVHHMKFLSFDNSIILTGANLNETYFRDRLDRYMVLDNVKGLVDYLGKVFNQLSSIYDSLEVDGTFKHPEAKKSFCLPSFKNDIESLSGDSVYIFPSFQLSKHSVFQDSLLQRELLAAQEPLLKEGSEVLFCTSYFNPKGTLLEQMFKSKANWKVLTSGPLANSFYGAKGAIGMVPGLYQQRLHQFAQETQARKANVKSYEYTRPGYTFHAKGFLSHLKDSSTFSCIGSSNFGYRSAQRDNELQFYMVSKNPAFNDALTRSFKDLFSFGNLFDFTNNNHSLITRVASRLLRCYL